MFVVFLILTLRSSETINDNLEAQAATLFKELFIDNSDCDDWSEGHFTDIVQILGGGTPSTINTDFWGGNISFFTPKDVSNESYCMFTEKTLTKRGLESCSSRLYPVNTVFVTARGTVGNMSLAGVPMAMNQSCYALKGKAGYKQLFTYFLAKYVINTLKRKSVGAVFNAFVTKDFDMEKIIIPPTELALQFELQIKPLFETILSTCQEIEQLNALSVLILTNLSHR